MADECENESKDSLYGENCNRPNTDFKEDLSRLQPDSSNLEAHTIDLVQDSVPECSNVSHDPPVVDSTDQNQCVDGENDTLVEDMLNRPVPEIILDNDLVVPSETDIKDSILGSDEWKAKERHIFILSSSGKPVYSRYGSEDKLVTLFGVMQALVSFVQDSGDTMESIHFGNNVMVFLSRGPIILVAVSKRNDSVKFLSNALLYVYNQIVSILTLKQVLTIFETRSNYDLRRLLTGSERLIDHLLLLYETEPSLFLNGLSCLPMLPIQRDALSSLISSACSKIKTLVFAVLIANNKLITLARKRKYSMNPSDLHLILNMIAASESFKTAESWTPICLPNFNSNGFLHGHVSYLTEECQACLLLLTVDQDIFFELSDVKKRITEKMKKQHLISTINEVLLKPPSSWVSLHKIGVNKIRHFVYKCKKSSNVLSSPLTPPYSTSEEANKLFNKYQTIYFNMMESNLQVHNIFQEYAEETIACLIADKYEILVSLEPMLKKQAALDSILKLCQWIQKEEDKFFLINVPYF